MRRLVRLLTLALIPVLFVATAVRADAATVVYGPKIGATLTWNEASNIFGFDESSCAFSTYWQNNDLGFAALNVQGSGCSFDFGFDWYHIDDHPENHPSDCGDSFAECNHIDLNFTGSGCPSGGINVNVTMLPDSSKYFGIGTGQNGPLLTSTVAACSITQVCGSWSSLMPYASLQFFTNRDVHSDGACAALAVPTPPVVTPTAGTCSTGAVVKPAIGAVQPYGWNPSTTGGTDYRNWSRAAPITYTATNTGGGRWAVYYVVDKSLNPGAGWSTTGTNAWAPGLVDNINDNPRNRSNSVQIVTPLIGNSNAQAAAGASLSNAVRLAGVGPSSGFIGSGSTSASAPAAAGNILGVGYYYWTTGSLGANEGDFPNATTDLGHAFGINDASRCFFYWGAKIINDPSTTRDEPLGPIGTTGTSTPPTGCGATGTDPCTTPGTPQGDGCGFKITDPSTYAGAGICRLVNIMGKLISAVGAVTTAVNKVVDAVLGLGTTLASAIGSAIATGFATLGPLMQTWFVPDPDSWGLEDLQDSFNSRPPGSIIGGMAETAYATADSFGAASSACNTVIDPLPQIAGDATELDACEVRNSSGMGALYSIVKLAIVAMTALACFKLVAAQIGDN